DIVPLLVHCHSGDDDFGNHTLHPGQSFSWSFKSNFFSRTLYSCRFWWGPRQSGFDVFYAKWKTTHNTYNYVVKGDGFYVNFDGDDHDRFRLLNSNYSRTKFKSKLTFELRPESMKYNRYNDDVIIHNSTINNQSVRIVQIGM
ncbi:hypothetical protein MIMGU_mgv11b022741mg, partial [Erythranthe guttata]